MALADLVMPKMGESIMEATILRWHKKVGDVVKQDETVLDIATDKVDSEVPSTVAGTIKEILYNVNDVVPVGAVLAKIEVADTAGNSSPAPTPIPAAAKPETRSMQVNANGQFKTLEPAIHDEPVAVPFAPNAAQINNNTSGNNRFYSPLVLNIANSEGISMAELENIPGTGAEGRVSKKDILQYLSDKKAGKVKPAVAPAPQPANPVVNVPHIIEEEIKAVPESPAPITIPQQNVEIIEMDRMRKLIAKHMVDSKHTSPHVTSFTEADVTNMVLWRNKVKDNFEKVEGTKITFTPMFIECIVKVLKRFPIVNSSVDGDKIIIKKNLNIGMATALPNGNLIVPVIKNAENLSLVGLTKAVNSLADNARNNKLKPDDTQGGTFTLTNVGTFGSLMGTPIINQPQVAILAVGAIKKRPVVIETDKGDYIGIRHMMYLSMSYDHRIIDGSIGASFLHEVAKEFEAWDVNRELKLVVQEHYID
ncbi:dihydrolipoamide acetyltransferase family protein [Hydrotalea sandarakina]|jgi:2-oxoglutarate dehydrogenase E2 component (dihydrolipoamide succinyltransferase)|uniref:Dihydrolipoamide acetyltransferase component of pyruvate dehydrogenase complex n=1 Tax=Hydrotalea sandarakina TaxID=1004304 RepID=A0A2W7RYE9_9BACT|nr:dihydrolipoamide acetyltransferase family protein [Hydrotalea sandarakina]PZX65531.1 2-oxoglutarate dehydrogenase E2 component (dihydrolipoamide succinyltransferase) [Hydrotalea sandarakina]